ncbi:MAG: helix-turn-helix domain-containing protein [Alphaproteobacteria bacterium]
MNSKTASRRKYKPAKESQRSPTKVDSAVGQRVRQRRTFLGWSQEELAAKLNISFQQVQKYEAGTNRIGASRLYQLAKILKTDINHFYSELPRTGSPVLQSPTQRKKTTTQLRQKNAKIIKTSNQKNNSQRELLALVRAYNSIKQPEMRRNLVRIVNSFAEESSRRSVATRKKKTTKASSKTSKAKTKTRAKAKTKAKTKTRARTKTGAKTKTKTRKK